MGHDHIQPSDEQVSEPTSLEARQLNFLMEGNGGKRVGISSISVDSEGRMHIAVVDGGSLTVTYRVEPNPSEKERKIYHVTFTSDNRPGKSEIQAEFFRDDYQGIVYEHIGLYFQGHVDIALRTLWAMQIVSLNPQLVKEYHISTGSVPVEEPKRFMEVLMGYSPIDPRLDIDMVGYLSKSIN